MIARTAAALLGFCLCLPPIVPAWSQHLPGQVAAATTPEPPAKPATSLGAAVLQPLMSEELIARAIDRAATSEFELHTLFRRLTTTPARDLPPWKRWIVQTAYQALGNAGTIERLWEARKETVVAAVAKLEPEKRARLLAKVDAALRALIAYQFDRNGLKEALAERTAMHGLQASEGALYARSVREVERSLDERLTNLTLDRDGVLLAQDLWSAGGDRLLDVLLKVGSELKAALLQS